MFKKKKRTPEALCDKADALCDAGFYDKAIDCFNKVLAQAPNNVRALMGKGDALICKGHLYKNALALSENDQRLKDEKAKDHYNEATACFDGVLKIDPKNVAAWQKKIYVLGIADLKTESMDCKVQLHLMELNCSTVQPQQNQGAAFNGKGSQINATQPRLFKSASLSTLPEEEEKTSSEDGQTNSLS